MIDKKYLKIALFCFVASIWLLTIFKPFIIQHMSMADVAIFKKLQYYYVCTSVLTMRMLWEFYTNSDLSNNNIDSKSNSNLDFYQFSHKPTISKIYTPLIILISSCCLLLLLTFFRNNSVFFQQSNSLLIIIYGLLTTLFLSKISILIIKLTLLKIDYPESQTISIKNTLLSIILLINIYCYQKLLFYGFLLATNFMPSDLLLVIDYTNSSGDIAFILIFIFIIMSIITFVKLSNYLFYNSTKDTTSINDNISAIDKLVYSQKKFIYWFLQFVMIFILLIKFGLLEQSILQYDPNYKIEAQWNLAPALYLLIMMIILINILVFNFIYNIFRTHGYLNFLLTLIGSLITSLIVLYLFFN